MAEHFQHEDLLRQRVSEVRAVLNRTHLERALLQFSIIVVVVVLLGGLSEAVGEFSSAVRTILFGIFEATLVTVFIVGVGRSVLKFFGVMKSYSDSEVARIVGASFSAIGDRLLNMLELADDLKTGSSRYSSDLTQEAIKEFTKETEGIDFKNAVDRRNLILYSKVLSGSVLALMLSFVILPITMPAALTRLIHFSEEFTLPAKFTFEVYPGNKEIVKGENVEISIRVIPQSNVSVTPDRYSLSFFMRRDGQEHYEISPTNADSSGVYRVQMNELRHSIDYYASLEGATSDHFRLEVVDRPVIRLMQIRIDPPAYTRIASRVQEDFLGDITAPIGSKVTIGGTSSKHLQKMNLLFGNGNKANGKTEQTNFTVSFTLLDETTYKIMLEDQEHLTNINPVEYRLKPVPDEIPQAAILRPGRNIDVAGVDILPLLIQIKDDYGFTQLRLAYRMIKSRYEEIGDLYSYSQITPFDSLSTSADKEYQWNIGTLRLAPEDVIEYFVEVFDNDRIHGPKVGRSAVFLLRLPSLEEVFTDAEKTQDQSTTDMRQTLKEAKKLKEEIENLDREMKTNKEMDWQQKKKVDDLAKKYEALQKKVEETKKNVDRMVEQMQQHNIVSKETLQKYMELQQLMAEINSEALQKTLRQMQQAMQQVDKRAMQEAMKSLEFSEERFREGIERTLSLMKRLHIEQKVDEVRKRAEALAQEQQQLREEAQKNANDTKKREELAKRQEALSKEEARLEAEAKDLQQRMEEFFTEMPASQLDSLNRQLQSKRIGEKMQKSAQMMRQGNMQAAQQTQEQARQELQEFADQMNMMQQEMLQKQDATTVNALRKAVSDLIELSKEQESVWKQAQGAPSNSPQLRENAQRQLNLMQDLGNVINNLGELSQKSFVVTPEMGRALGEAAANMQQAMQGLEIRNGMQAAASQGQAMASLNKAAVQTENALSQMLQKGGGGGLMGQLQAMGQQQMNLNARTQQMMGEGGDNQMSQERAAQAGRLAQEQDAIRKSVEQLNREAEMSGEQSKMLGDLDRVAQEMKEVVKELERNNINSEVVQRQERILSRLLESSRSLRERDYEKRRLARTGTPISRRSPDRIDTNGENQNLPGSDLLNAPSQGYSKDYQELIRKYYESLQKARNQ
jgi:hypothetical protein